MKKSIIALFFATALFTACDDSPSTGDVSSITNYPLFTITGDNPYFVPKGTAYVDPGAVATEGGTEIPVTTTAVGKYRGATTLDTNIVDEYAVTYTATNVDGFAGTATRKVIVYETGDLVNSIAGVYTCTISRNGVTPSAAYQNIKYIYIWENADGTFQISDAFGGWYEFGRGLGVGFITPGGTIDGDIPTNNFTFPGNPLTNTYFGGTALITDMTVNAATKTIVLTSSWDAAPGYIFVATLTQVQI